MWLSWNTLSDLVDLTNLSVEEVVERLTMSTAEIESIEPMNPHLAQVIAAKIIDIMPHPHADKLTLVDVDTGKEKVRIVCGAPNHKKGDIVALAPCGTTLKEGFTVHKTKIRGEESCGMLCSEKELGLSDDHSGIIILPPHTQLGKPLNEIFKEWYDVRIEIDNKSITHRPDLWCHEGFAREIAALFGRKLIDPVDYSIEKSFGKSDALAVVIENGDAAPRYCGLYVKNINIAPSPSWLKARITAIGMRPINNIVDITNYVMSEIGEPMHAFDRKKLRGNTIIVRMARDGEPITTLDGNTHVLSKDDIVIADAGGPIALAGVMGGGESEIDDSTQEIVLEAANFNPIHIRRTAGRYNLRTEAAIRFEKSLDPELCPRAIIRCYQLIKEIIPQAEAITSIVDAYPKKLKKISITTSFSFIRRKLGTNISNSEICNILKSLQFTITESGDTLSIEVPSFRATKDISIPDDIVEEVGRIHGYDNIEPKAPLVPCAPPEKNEKRAFERLIKDIMVKDNHLIEVSNYSFVGEAQLKKLGLSSDKELKLKNPLSMEQDRLRRSLLPNLFNNAALNQRFRDEFQIFELGRVYLKDDKQSPNLAQEKTFVAGIVYARKPSTPLYYRARQIISLLLSKLNIKNFHIIPETTSLPPYAHPGRSAIVRAMDKEIGLIGELHPATIEALDMKGHGAFFDLDVDALMAAEKLPQKFTELPRFPEVPFEVSVLAPSREYAANLCDIVRASTQLVRSCEIISIYEGAPIPLGKKSVSLKVVFGSNEKTLEPSQIDELQKTVIAALEKNGYALR
ncbi:MAG: phenylalanine--tRNA ligase subunit beta [Spirochaetes bacterium]|nr:phenylalanine--tRNA ligase subunit beta [Spirochaetota bacterium]